MIGNLDPDERIMSEPSIIEQINSLVEKLKWETGDNIVVEVGGVASTGTATDPGANPKWAKPFGTVTYQKDAFIVIKNKSRDQKSSLQILIPILNLTTNMVKRSKGNQAQVGPLGN